MLGLVGKHDKKQDVYIGSKHLPARYLLIAKGKIVTLQWGHLANTTK